MLCKELKRREVGVSHTPFTLRLIAPGLCNEHGVTDKERGCVCVCVWVCVCVCVKDGNGEKRNEREKHTEEQNGCIRG